MILQSYDFRELHRRHGVGCRWAAPTSGATSSPAWNWRAAPTASTVFGLTTPLITTASGAKMGKTAKGAVWLTADRLSPTTTGNSGATPRTPMSAGSCGCSPTCRSTRSAAGRAAGRRDQRGEEDPGHRGDRRSRMAAPPPTAAAETARLAFEEGEAAETLPSVDVPAGELAAGIPAFRLLVAGRPGGQQRRGSPPDPRRRRSGQ